jgi:hypothetical protein
MAAYPAEVKIWIDKTFVFDEKLKLELLISN